LTSVANNIFKQISYIPGKNNKKGAVFSVVVLRRKD